MTAPLRAFGSRQIVNPFEGRLDTRKRRRFKEKTRELPKCPGVYFFHGHNDRLLYIGKAKCLRDRVRSYFADTSLPRPNKIKRLLVEIERYDFRPVGSELEALLLERRLIADMQPLLNRQHKRFEVYPYLLLSDETFPRLTLTRAEPVAGEKDEETKAILREISESMKRDVGPLETPKAGEVAGLYLGPFTTPRHAYWALDSVVKLFPLRSCDDDLVVDENGRGCFYREIGRCCGPCIGQTSAEVYRAMCDDLVRLLETGEAPQVELLKAKMLRMAEEWRFEDAAQVKADLEAIEAVAARLRRLTRMRKENNAVIAQPALMENGEPRTALFLVRGGAVRKHIIVGISDREWEKARDTIRRTFEAHWDERQFTAKTELDEMMIIDRWLRSHGTEPCVAWMNDQHRVSRQWASNAVRMLRSTSLNFVSANTEPTVVKVRGKVAKKIT